jgi:hypothetical protein
VILLQSDSDSTHSFAKNANEWGTRRFYDFNVWTERKRTEKLRYMHRNPVKRGLVEEPEQWAWSSFRYYQDREVGLVRVNDCDIMRMSLRESA